MRQDGSFIDRDGIYDLVRQPAPSGDAVGRILDKALELKGLDLTEAAALLRTEEPEDIKAMMASARKVKEGIYGKRLVLFAPIYTGNVCINNCLYCAFRRDNRSLKRKVLTMEEIEREVSTLLGEGHKRILLICGESPANDTEYMCRAIRTVYAVRRNGHYIRRINVELAPMSEDDFKRIHAEGIGTYVCFQETYDPVLYKEYHPAGTPKADYLNRLLVFDRAMRAGIRDVGLGALFGLADYRFEVLALLEHARHLEQTFGCGPHTISVPRIEPADNAPATERIPHPVSDKDFMKLVAVIRLALPYTGMILSTRESEAIRSRLFQAGISQISAGSRTNPGAYADGDGKTGSQFSLGDHRSLDEVIAAVVEQGYIPSFCTACYRQKRVGSDFMELAKPGLIQTFCLPNALMTFKEYLLDFARPATRKKGLTLIEKMTADVADPSRRGQLLTRLEAIGRGERDLFF